MRRNANSSKITYLVNCLFHSETLGNICLNSYRKDVSEAACYFRSRDYLEVGKRLGNLSRDQASHYAVMVCYYDPSEAFSNGSLYHLFGSIQRIESAAAPVAIYSVAVCLPLQHKRFHASGSYNG